MNLDDLTCIYWHGLSLKSLSKLEWRHSTDGKVLALHAVTSCSIPVTTYGPVEHFQEFSLSTEPWVSTDTEHRLLPSLDPNSLSKLFRENRFKLNGAESIEFFLPAQSIYVVCGRLSREGVRGKCAVVWLYFGWEVVLFAYLPKSHPPS